MKPSRWHCLDCREERIQYVREGRLPEYSWPYYRRLVAYYVSEARRWHRNAMYCKATMERLAQR
jgi:hypothetical protein